MLEFRAPSLNHAKSIENGSNANGSLILLCVQFVRRHALLLAMTAALGLVLGLAHKIFAQPFYSAQSVLLIDDSKVDLFQRPSFVNDVISDNAFIESQIEVLRSGTVAREVVRMLNLMAQTEPTPSGLSAWLASHHMDLDSIKSWFKSAAGGSTADGLDLPVDREGLVAAGLSDAVTVRRVGSTYAVTIIATAKTPRGAFELANAVPEAYITVDREAKQASTKRTVNWLDDRLRELRDKSAEADQAVDTFRRDRAGTTADKGLISSQLRQLESASLGYRNLYDSLQTRYLQAIQEESFTASKARVISPAIMPLGPSSPKLPISVAVGLLLGLVLGAGTGLARDALRNGLTSTRELETSSGVEVLGILRDLRTVSGGFAARIRGLFRERSRSAFARMAVRAPLDPFAQEIRRIAFSLIQRRTRGAACSVIGVVSLRPGEGKTTFSANLAHTLGAQGNNVLLIDMDIRNPSLSAALNAPSGAPSIFDPAEKLATIWRDRESPMDFLPTTHRADIVSNNRLFQSKELESTFLALRKRYQFIIVDLPPILAVADADAVKHLVDAFVLVVRHGGVPAALMHETLNRFDPQRDKIVGAVLNMSPVVDRHGSYGYDYASGHAA